MKKLYFYFTDALAATGNENLEFFLTDASTPPNPNAGPPYRLVAEERGTLLYMRSMGFEKRLLLGMGRRIERETPSSTETRRSFLAAQKTALG